MADRDVDTLADGRSFLGLFLPFRAPDAAGWDRVLRLVHALTEDGPDLWPRSIRVDGEWRAFEASRQPPDWWPLAQELAAFEPSVEWELAPAGFAQEALTQVLMRAAVDAATTERLLAAVLGAVLRAGASYAFLHHWTPAEALPSGAVGLRRDDPEGEPWVLLSERDLRVALPGPSWVQVIGPEWEAVLGRDRLGATPAHRVEEIRPHHWLVQLTASATDLAGLIAARDAVRAHLGADRFWTPGTAEVPRVTFTAVAGT